MNVDLLSISGVHTRMAVREADVVMDLGIADEAAMRCNTALLTHLHADHASAATPHRYRELAMLEMESMTGRKFWSGAGETDTTTEPGQSGATPSTASPETPPDESQSSPSTGLKT